MKLLNVAYSHVRKKFRVDPLSLPGRRFAVPFLISVYGRFVVTLTWDIPNIYTDILLQLGGHQPHQGHQPREANKGEQMMPGKFGLGFTLG